MKKVALLLNFRHIRKMPTNLTDFEKGRSPQEPTKDDVPPKPQQSDTKPNANATTRVTNNVGLGFAVSRLLTRIPTAPTPASSINASSSGRISARSKMHGVTQLFLIKTLGAALLVQTNRILATTVCTRVSRVAWLTVALGNL